MSVRRESQGQLPCGDVRAVSHLSVVQDLRNIAGNRSFKHVYLCSRRRLSPVAKASAKELSASYSARGSIPAALRADGQLTRTGQHYYSHLGLRPPSKDFDYNQPLICEGPNDYARAEKLAPCRAESTG